jgi:hypothetical protein
VFFEFTSKLDHVIATASDKNAQGYAVTQPFENEKQEGRLLVIGSDDTIYLAANHDLVLDVSNEAAKEGARVLLYKRKQNGAKNQSWVVKDNVVYSKLGDGSLSLDVDGEGHVVLSKNHTKINFRYPLLSAVQETKAIQILVANYGGKDVTDVAKQQHKSNKHFTASNAHFGDPLPNVPKFLHVIYSYNGVLGSVAIPEGQNFTPEPPKLVVLGALYGSADVTDKVKSLVPAGADNASFQVENSHFGDPDPNVFKNFTVAYVRNGELRVAALKEHDQANLN